MGPFRMPSALLWAYSAENYFYFAFVALCGALQTLFSRRGVVTPNCICSAAFYESAALRASACSQYPLSLLTAFAASSPKGTPLGCAGNFIATVEAVPLGKVASPQAMTEGVLPASCFAVKLQTFPPCQRLPPRGSWQSRQALTEGVQSVIFFSIPRFLPVENSLQLCYDRKQRIFPKIDSEEGNGSCVKVVF